MSSFGPHNNQIQKAGADSAYQGHATLPASDPERWIDSEDTIGYQNVPKLTAALKLARIEQRGFYHDLQAGRRVKKKD